MRVRGPVIVVLQRATNSERTVDLRHLAPASGNYGAGTPLLQTCLGRGSDRVASCDQPIDRVSSNLRWTGIQHVYEFLRIEFDSLGVKAIEHVPPQFAGPQVRRPSVAPIALEQEHHYRDTAPA